MSSDFKTLAELVAENKRLRLDNATLFRQLAEATMYASILEDKMDTAGLEWAQKEFEERNAKH